MDGALDCEYRDLYSKRRPWIIVASHAYESANDAAVFRQASDRGPQGFPGSGLDDADRICVGSSLRLKHAFLSPTPSEIGMNASCRSRFPFTPWCSLLAELGSARSESHTRSSGLFRSHGFAEREFKLLGESGWSSPIVPRGAQQNFNPVNRVSEGMPPA